MLDHLEHEGQGEGKLIAVLLLFLLVTAPVVFFGWGFLNAVLEAEGGLGAGLGSLLCLVLFLLLAGIFSRFLLRYSEAGNEPKRSRAG
ncbi:hypothetical protein MAMC_00472 [Methylacidimicrobium cyclopophantes]|uniref:Uncharacterized protein n=1 Tax=Methylacidimicrobium cyclopophantes TaxID=1041766 RepID=A0A5E6MBT4_9BACT|nr:hypothetical protein [Methylacidimicrobium cyclopophantes]VVM05240.1 hypothetical protein MAMC_00472 [Methylacidimicrobium cyclopophantes]